MHHPTLATGNSVLLTLVLSALVASATAAQNGQSVTVSSPTDAADEGVTVKIKDDKENVTLSNFTGEQGSKKTGDDLPKGMDPKLKAERIAKAINEAPENTRADGTQRVEATPNGSKVDVKPKDSKVKVEKVSLNSNTGEKQDKMAQLDPDADSVFTADLVGALVYADGCGDASVLRVATNRGVVEIALAGVGSPHQALLLAADGLAQFGVAAWVEENTIGFLVDASLDQFVEFGCTDLGVSPTMSLECLPGSGEGGGDASGD